MNISKKLVSLLLALVMVFSLVACGTSNDKKDESAKESTVESKKEGEVTKVEEKKAEDKKTAEKKPTAKKPTAKKEVTETVFVQFAGKEVAVSDMMPKIKKVWQSAGNRIKDIQDVKLYVKPEDGKVYFVINDDFSDSVDFE